MHYIKEKYKILCLFLMVYFLCSNAISAEEQYKGDLWNLLNCFRIKTALNQYQEIERNGGWPVLPYDIVLKKGDSSEHILALRKRLAISGDFNNNEVEINLEYFDGELEKGIKKFQHRHGLVEDGILGIQTINALNIPVEEKIKRLELAEKKTFNLFDKYIAEYILVNIPAYELKGIKNGKEILQMKVIVGKASSKTPIFNDEIEYLVFNPSWRIPIRKTITEIIPMIKNDPAYLERKNIRVFDSWGENAVEINPTDIDWDKYNLNNFDLMLEQDAGPGNELGKVKFMFPNKYLVYIHDTPAQELFEYRVRTFSSGCIRVEKPIELALFCLENEPDWNREKVMEFIEMEESLEVNLSAPIPVVIVYWTTWVDEDGVVHFRDNIYNLSENF